MELLGLENLSNAFGLSMIFNGLACFVGIPVSGILIDYTGELWTVFVFGGTSMAVSGLILIPVKQVKNPLKPVAAANAIKPTTSKQSQPTTSKAIQPPPPPTKPRR